MICKELNKEFDDKAKMFEALKANKELIIKEKKSQIFKSCDKGLGVGVKGLKVDSIKGVQMDSNYHYIAVNTTNILDSHGDVHVKGIWNKSVKDQQGKNYLVLDHELSVSSVVARKENVEMFISDVSFGAIGKGYEGETQALIYKVAKSDVINPLAKEWLDSGSDIEASVRMQYVNIELALNSDSFGDQEEKSVYDQYINQIANKNDFDSIDYFWVVKEAKNVGESSLVLAGSNGATGVLNEAVDNTSTNNKSVQPSKDIEQKNNLETYNFI
jgi:hypothetical protein